MVKKVCKKKKKTVWRCETVQRQKGLFFFVCLFMRV